MSWANNLDAATNLRLQRDEAMAELRRRDVEEVRQRVAALEAAKHADEERARAEAERVAAEEMERHRRSAWLNYASVEAANRGNESFLEYLTGDLGRHVPKDPLAWPPGTAPEQHRLADVPEDEADIGNTLLGQWLSKAGVKV